MCETIESGYMASNMEDQEIVLALKHQLNVMFQALQAITTSSANLATLTGMLQPVRPPEHISRFVMMFNFWNEYHKNYPVYLREANECLEQELNDLIGALSSDSHPLAKEQKVKHHTDHLMTAVCTLIQRFCSTGSILLHELPNEAFDPSPPTGRAVSPHRPGGYSQGPSVSPPVPHAARAQSPLRACLEQMQGPLPNPGQLVNTKKPFLPPGMHRFNPNVPGPRRWSEAAVDTNNQTQQDNSIRRWSMPMQSRFIPMMGQPAGPESAQASTAQGGSQTTQSDVTNSQDGLADAIHLLSYRLAPPRSTLQQHSPKPSQQIFLQPDMAQQGFMVPAFNPTQPPPSIIAKNAQEGCQDYVGQVLMPPPPLPPYYGGTPTVWLARPPSNCAQIQENAVGEDDETELRKN